MARLYTDENLAFPVVLELRRLGYDVLTTQEAGKAEQAIPDDEVLQYTCDPVFAAQAARIDAAIREQPELYGTLLRINRPPY